MAWTHGTLMLDSSPLAEFISTGWKGVDVPIGAELLRQGDSAGSVFLVARGFAKLWRSSVDGKVVIVGLRGHGWLLGFAAAVLDSPSAVTATVLTRCRVHPVPSAELRKRLQDDS